MLPDEESMNWHETCCIHKIYIISKKIKELFNIGGDGSAWDRKMFDKYPRRILSILLVEYELFHYLKWPKSSFSSQHEHFLK